MRVAGAVAGIVLSIATQNIRQGLPPPDVRHDLNQAAARSSVVLTQEMGKRNAAKFRPTGWGSAHGHGIRRGDCATYWDRDEWRLRRWWTTPLTFADFRAGHRFALTTVLSGHGSRMAVVCVHFITHWTQRRAVYAAGVRRLRSLLGRLVDRYPTVVVGGDWNRPWPSRAALPGFRSHSPLAATGHRGGRIDYAYWHHARFRSVTVLRHTFSDHNGVRYRLRLGG